MQLVGGTTHKLRPRSFHKFTSLSSLQEFLHSVHVQANSADFHLQVQTTPNKISYSGSLSIMTGAGADCILSEKVLDVVGLSMDTWKTG